MRNDEGTTRKTPRRRVGGYCSAGRPERSRERSLEKERLDVLRERSRSYRESRNSRTLIKWTCSVREKKKRGMERRGGSSLQQISRAARKINQKLWNVRREEVSISLSHHVFISRFNSSMILTRSSVNDNFESF